MYYDSGASTQKAKVLFDFVPQAPNQIALKVGQIINVSVVGAKGGWSRAEEIGTGLNNL